MPDAAVLAALAGGRLRRRPQPWSRTAIATASRPAFTAGAALDVYEREPLPADHPFRRHGDVLLSAHSAGASCQAPANIVGLATDDLHAAVEGRPVTNVVNDVDPVIRRPGRPPSPTPTSYLRVSCDSLYDGG